MLAREQVVGHGRAGSVCVLVWLIRESKWLGVQCEWREQPQPHYKIVQTIDPSALLTKLYWRQTFVQKLFRVIIPVAD